MKRSLYERLLRFIARAIGLYATNPFAKQGPFAELIKRLLFRERGRKNPLFAGGQPAWDGLRNLPRGSVVPPLGGAESRPAKAGTTNKEL